MSPAETLSAGMTNYGLDGLLDSVGAAVPSGPLAGGGPLAGVSRRRGMSQGDHVLLGIGIAIASLVVLGMLVVLPVLGGVSAGIAFLVLLVGAAGAGLTAFALRRQLPVACGVGAGIVALLLIGVLLSTRAKDGATSVAQAPPPVATPGTVPPSEPVAAAFPPPVSPAVSPAGSPAVSPPVPTPSSSPATPPDSEGSPFVPVTSSSSPPMPQQAASPAFAQAEQPPHPARSELIGGHENGSVFEVRHIGATVTSVTYREGTSDNESGFTDIVPTSSMGETPPHSGSQPGSQTANAVTAKDGYAVGGIQTDSGGSALHAFQIVFMRLRPDGRLDPNDSYASEWVGKPTGPVQKAASSGAKVVGFFGRRTTLVHSIGLVFATPGTALAANSSTASGQSSVPSLPEMMAGARDAAEAKLPALPAMVTGALDSTVLVEHTLGSGSGFAVAKNVVATNAHVVEGAFPDEIKVKHGGENNAAERISRVLHFDRDRDLCLLEGDMDLTALPVRSDYELKPGDPAVLMGNPSVRGGILMRNVTNRGKLRTLVHIEGQDLYHIDADVNPGWSGGPILDMEGRVIAVVVMKANDNAAAEIRSAMRKMDDSFRAANTSTHGGITYGIPASALAKLLKDGTLTDKQRQTVTNDRYVAQTVVSRMSALAGLAMLNIQANVPVQVRMEADALAKGGMVARPSRFSTVRVEYVPLLPEQVCRALMAFLKSRKVRELEDHFRKNLDSRLASVAESQHVASEVKRDLKTLAKKTKDAETYADRPGTKYAAYSIKVSGFKRDIEELIERLEKKVNETEP